ncbi:MAG TPA: beta-ketoacyl-ACP synthase III [Ruminiclostridium sp.]|nr:beta-ketoacyl-ACP synthase III [Ruminiclostridium sp.]
MAGVFIAGTGMYVPSQVVTNDDLAKIVDTSDEWISKRTGIRERRISHGETNSYMGIKAAEQAIENAGINAAELDMIIGCTCTPDYFYPSLACIIQDALGADDAFCWDLNGACSGFIYALDVAQHYLTSGKKNILIVCSEVMSKHMDFSDRSTCVLFGDGSAAVVLKPSNGLYASYLKSIGSLGKNIVSTALRPRGIYAVDKDNPNYIRFENTENHYIRMAGSEVYRFAVKAMPQALEGAADNGGISLDELDLIIPHQANLRIIETASKRLGIGMEKMYVNVEKYGNTSCVSIPLSLAELNAQGKLQRGEKIGLVGFGAGLTYGSVVFEW